MAFRSSSSVVTSMPPHLRAKPRLIVGRNVRISTLADAIIVVSDVGQAGSFRDATIDAIDERGRRRT